jgi:hypothetical protein
MEIHPLCLILPEMSKADYSGLLEDIRAKGLVFPIKTYEGKVLDGRHRLKACLELGLSPRFEEYTGTDPAGYVASTCQHRSLNASQRALIAAGFLEYERGQAKGRMKEAGAVGGRAKGVEDFPPPFIDHGKARDKAGARMHVSGRTVDDAEKVMENATPEVLEKVRSGDMALNEAKKIVQLNPDAQRRVIETPKKARQAALREAMHRKEAAQRRHKPPPVITEPGSAFVRKFLNGVERIAVMCAEDGAKDAQTIASQFMEEMDWKSDALVLQLERCEPVIRALSIIVQHKKAA